jgi:hypothetical protein
MPEQRAGPVLAARQAQQHQHPFKPRRVAVERVAHRQMSQRRLVLVELMLQAWLAHRLQRGRLRPGSRDSYFPLQAQEVRVERRLQPTLALTAAAAAARRRLVLYLAS